jgi:hypothetical protein
VGGGVTAGRENLLNYCYAASRHRNCYDLYMLPTVAAAAKCLSVFTVVQQQPALRFEQGKGPREFLVFDYWRHPPRTD